MSNKLAVSPHIHGGKSTSGIMLDVLIALLPAAIAAMLVLGLVIFYAHAKQLKKAK